MGTNNKPSLIGLAYRRAAVILLVMVLLVGVNLAVTFHYTRAAGLAGVERTATEQATLLAQQLELYRRVLRHVARQTEVHDLLLLANEDAAQRWASNARHYLPGSVGLALVTPEGAVLGTPVALQVGAACLADLEAYLTHGAVDSPAVHLDNPRLAHFDLVEAVTDHGGETLGLIFASFDLEGLHATLAGVLQDDQLLTLVDGTGQSIAVAGGLSSAAAVDALRHRMSIPGTTWALEMAQRPPSNRPIYLTIGATSLLAALLIVALVILLTSRLIRIFVGEFHRIKALLARVSGGQDLEAGQARFRETDALVPLIQRLADNIRRQQLTLTQQSLSDELTGLPNRRHFGHEMQRALELARRGTPVGLLVIDIDHFKDVNDGGGHAAGDRVLQALAAALRENVRKTDFAARLGGDEFAAILVNPKPDKGQLWLDRLKRQFGRQAARHDVRVVPGLSAGLAVIDNADASVEGVMQRADGALYAAKAQGRGRLEVAASAAGAAGAGRRAGSEAGRA